MKAATRGGIAARATVCTLVVAVAGLVSGTAAGAKTQLVLPSQPGEAAVAPSVRKSSDCRDGYRRQSVVHDYALGQSWVILANCAHPEMPRIAIAGRSTSEPFDGRKISLGAAAIIASGSRVRLWRRDAVARIDLSGVALDAGASGEVIRVRVGPNASVLRGRVRSVDSVELESDSGTVSWGVGFGGVAR